MSCEIEHEESWTLKIGREPSDDWPDVLWHGRARRMLRPRLIMARLHRGQEGPRVSAHGEWHLLDGTPTGQQAGVAIYGDRAPWVTEIVELARAGNNLGPEETEVGW